MVVVVVKEKAGDRNNDCSKPKERLLVPHCRIADWLVG